MTTILAWFNPARWLMAMGVVASLLIGYLAWETHQQHIGEARMDARWKLATVELKREAREALDAQKKLVADAERSLQEFKNQQEVKDATNQNTVASLSGRLRDLVRVNDGRLRDPNATGCRSSSSGSESGTTSASNAGASNGTETGGLLSQQLSNLLLQRLNEADTINNAYIACRADTYKLRAVAR